MPDTLIPWAALTARQRDALVAERIMGRDIRVASSHEWERTEDGEIDTEAWDTDGHNGPYCLRCKYGFCIFCEGEEGYTKQPCQPYYPHCTTSLESACQVEDAIGQRGLTEQYIDALISVCELDHIRFTGRGTDVQCDHSALWPLIRATPEQRCHAALIACGVLPHA